MFLEGADASKNMNNADVEYYDDNFEYYEDYYLEEDLKELKHKLGIAQTSSEPKLSFLQLLQNLQGDSVTT